MQQRIYVYTLQIMKLYLHWSKMKISENQLQVASCGNIKYF